MKKLLYLTLFLGACSQPSEVPENEARVEGILHGAGTREIILRYRLDEEVRMDTALIRNDSFRFDVPLDRIAEASLFTDDSSMNIEIDRGYIPYTGTRLYLIPGERITVKGDYSHYAFARVKGGHDNAVLMELKEKDSALQQARWELTRRYYQAASDSQRQETFDGLNRLLDSINDLHTRFYFSRPDSRPAAKFIYQSLFDDFDYHRVDSFYQLLPEEISQSEYGLKLLQKAQSLKKTAVGSRAPEFEKMTPDSTMLHLSQLKGQVVLLDFWGSWCVPCRKANPKLRELYDRYHDAGFEILSVAQEGGTPERAWSNWKRAIANDSIGHWYHVLNDAGRDTVDIVNLYGVSAFPTQVLLDRQGTIIRKDIGNNNSLETWLEEVFPETGIQPAD